VKVLDLFCGLKGWSKAFEDRNHEVITLDIEPRFNPTICKDILEVDVQEVFSKYGHFNVILASPPCECFSIASVYRHWDKKNKTAKDGKTIHNIKLVLKTIELIQELRPDFWIIENPKGMLRKIIGYPHYEITQCQYGREVMKPTDLWGRLPKEFNPLKCKPGMNCHERATRSSRKGVQAIISSLDKKRNPELRALIPYGLSLAVCKACEKELSIPPKDKSLGILEATL